MTLVIKFWRAVVTWPAGFIRKILGSWWAREVSFIMTLLSTSLSTAHASYGSLIPLQVSLGAGCDSQRFTCRNQITEESGTLSGARAKILFLLCSPEHFLTIKTWTIPVVRGDELPMSWSIQAELEYGWKALVATLALRRGGVNMQAGTF